MTRYICKVIMLLFLPLAFAACKKSHELPANTQHGRIIQVPPGFYNCAICGGYLVKFDDDTSITYHSLQILDNFGITASSSFPVKAYIGWKPDTSIKVPNYITITSIKIDN